MWRRLGWFVCGVLLFGCSRAEYRAGSATSSSSKQLGLATRMADAPGGEVLRPALSAGQSGSDLPAAGPGYGGGASAAVPDRKIIYNASLGLVVSDFSALESKLPALVRGAQGYISEAQSDQQQGERTSGTWVVRIPSGDFEGFLQNVANLGVVEARRVTTEEVTEEYVDLEARIANKQKMEERVLEIIKQRSGPLAEVLQLEAELSRIREEIERMQGRLRLLANQTALATVRISAREEHDYVPPQQPTLATQLRETWQGSWKALSGLGAAALLLTVAVAPWMLIVIPVGGLTALVWRRVLRNQAMSRQGTA